MAEKVTWMVVKVELNCSSCYKKVKKILCKFPEIRDQVYIEQRNEVRITVVCCSPERIRDELLCKGRKVIKSVDIVVPPKQPDKAADPPKTTTPTTAPPEPKPKPKPQVAEVDLVPVTVIPSTPGAALGIPIPTKPYPFPFGFCCPQCFQGHGGGLCHHECWRHLPGPPPPNTVINNYCSGHGCHYFSEEDPSGCTIM